LGKPLARASTVGKPSKAYKPHQAARPMVLTRKDRRFFHTCFSSKNNPSKPNKPNKLGGAAITHIAVFIVTVALSSLLAVLDVSA
jgi:hypothetical protein